MSCSPLAAALRRRVPRRVAAGLLLGAIVLPGCGRREPEAAAGATGPKVLRVVVLPFLSYAPFFIGIEEGYFAEQGIEIEMVRLARGSDALPALAQGDLDVASTATAVGVLAMMARGLDLRFVADKGYLPADGCAFNAILARRSLLESGKLSGPQALRGLKVDLDTLHLEAYTLSRLLAGSGLRLEDLEIVDVPPASEADALARGAIDLTVASEPDVTRLLDSGEAVIWKATHEILPDAPLSSLVFGPSLLERDRDAGRRFVTAFLRAARQANRRGDRELEIVARHSGLDRALLERACWPRFRADGGVSLGTLRDFQRWAVDRSLLDRVLEPSALWDPYFVESAVRALDVAADAAGGER